jgi:pilus assembly protein Flp/PilA
MRNSVVTFLRDEQGLTMVEYAVAGTLICLAAVGAFRALGTQVANQINLITLTLFLGGFGL